MKIKAEKRQYINMKYTINDITVIILAGGRGSRLGNQNKGLIKLNNTQETIINATKSKPVKEVTFVSHLLSKLISQSQTQIISANDNISEYEKYNTRVIQDQTGGYQGPLSGIISCKSFIHTPLVLTVPCDSPLVPDTLSQRLLDTYNQKDSTQICVAHDGTRLQNLFMLFDTQLLDNMNDYFHENNRRVHSWIECQNKLKRFQQVDFSDCAINFTNVNNEENLQALLKLEPSLGEAR